MHGVVLGHGQLSAKPGLGLSNQHRLGRSRCPPSHFLRALVVAKFVATRSMLSTCMCVSAIVLLAKRLFLTSPRKVRMGAMGALLGFFSTTPPLPPPPQAPLSKRRTPQGTGTAFTRWSDNLYCSGASGQSCRLANGRDVLSGMCHWQKQHAQHRWLPVEEADMNTTKRPTFVGHRWDPLQPHGPRSGESGESDQSGFRYFGRDAASRCLQGKRVLVAGDSTTRDTFYELVTVPPA
jgi:hypothetical protein